MIKSANLNQHGRSLRQADWGSLGRILADKLSAYLARRIDNLRRKVLTTVFDYFAERVLDGGIVAIYKMAIHKLHSE